MRRTGRGWVMLVGALLPSMAWASGPAIQLPDSETGRALGVVAQNELGADFVVYAPSPAPLRVAVEQRDEQLLLVVTGEDGVWAERRFSLPLKAALRAAVAAIQHVRENYETSTPPALGDSKTATSATEASSRVIADGPPSGPPTTTETTETTETTTTSELPDRPAIATDTKPKPAPDAGEREETEEQSAAQSTGRLHLGGQAALAFNHSSPALGFQVRVQARWKILQAGFLFGAYGLGCCGRSVEAADQTALDGSPRAIDLLANLDVQIANPGAVAFGVSGSGGAEQLRIDVTPVIFAGPAPTTTTTRWSPVARLGAWAGGPVAFDWLRWRADVGLQLRFRSTAVALPAGFPAQSEPLTMGRFVPIMAVGLEGIFF